MTHDKIVDQVITLLRSQDKHGGYFHQETRAISFAFLFLRPSEVPG
jgi:hypothetical protein